jgi:hypothetical protein
MAQTDPPATPSKSKKDEEDEVDRSNRSESGPMKRRLRKAASSMGNENDQEENELQHTDTSESQHYEFLIDSQFKAILAFRINILLVLVPIIIALHEVGCVNRVTVFVVNFLAIIPLAVTLSFATEELALYAGQTLGGLLNASSRTFAYTSNLSGDIYCKPLLRTLLKVAYKILSCGQLSTCFLTLPFLLASAQPIEGPSGLARTQSGPSARTWVSIGCIALWAIGILGAALTLQYNTSVSMGWLTLSGAFALMASFAWLMLQTPSMYDKTDPFKYLVLATSHMFVLWFISQPSADTDRRTLLWTTFLGFAFILLTVGVSIPADGPGQTDPTIPSGEVDMMIYAVKYWAPSPLYFIAWAILVRIVFYCFGHYFRSLATEQHEEENVLELEPAAAQIASESSAQTGGTAQVGNAEGVDEVSAT